MTNRVRETKIDRNTETRRGKDTDKGRSRLRWPISDKLRPTICKEAHPSLPLRIDYTLLLPQHMLPGRHQTVGGLGGAPSPSNASLDPRSKMWS